MFGKIKQVFGVDTIKVVLEVPPALEKSGTALSGTIRIIAQSDQFIHSITVRLIERYSKGRGSERTISEFDLGEIKLKDSFEITSGAVKEIPFRLPYAIIKSKNDQLKEQGGALGRFGKLASMADAELSQFFVRVAVSVKGTAFDPLDQKSIKLV